MITFSEHIKMLFQTQGASLSAFCDETNCCEDHIHDIMKRKSLPSKALLKIIFKHLNVSKKRQGEILESYEIAEVDKITQDLINFIAHSVITLDKKLDRLHKKFDESYIER